MVSYGMVYADNGRLWYLFFYMNDNDDWWLVSWWAQLFMLSLWMRNVFCVKPAVRGCVRWPIHLLPVGSRYSLGWDFLDANMTRLYSLLPSVNLNTGMNSPGCFIIMKNSCQDINLAWVVQNWIIPRYELFFFFYKWSHEKKNIHLLQLTEHVWGEKIIIGVLQMAIYLICDWWR